MTEPGKLKITETAAGVIFNVHVQPRASRNELRGIHDGEIKLSLTSPPVEDAANKLCMEFLAKSLGIAKSKVSITAGAKSRHKTIKVDGVDSARILQLLDSVDRHKHE